MVTLRKFLQLELLNITNFVANGDKKQFVFGSIYFEVTETKSGKEVY